MKMILTTLAILSFWSVNSMADSKTFSGSCSTPVDFESECTPPIPGDVTVNNPYLSSQSCAQGQAMDQCWSAGYTNCTNEGSDNGLIVNGNGCQVTSYVIGNK